MLSGRPPLAAPQLVGPDDGVDDAGEQPVGELLDPQRVVRGHRHVDRHVLDELAHAVDPAVALTTGSVVGGDVHLHALVAVALQVHWLLMYCRSLK